MLLVLPWQPAFVSQSCFIIINTPLPFTWPTFRVQGTAPTRAFLGRMKYLYQRIRRTFLVHSVHWDKAGTQTSDHPFASLASGSTFAGRSWAELVTPSLPRDDRAAGEHPVLLITSGRNTAGLVTQPQQRSQDSPLQVLANTSCPTLPRCTGVSRRVRK